MTEQWIERMKSLKVPEHLWAAYYVAKMSDRKSRHKQNKRAKDRHKSIIHSAKDKPCTDCGNLYPPEVMELDHVRGEKLFPLAVSGHIRSVSALLREIAKCEVRCPTCHRLRHYWLRMVNNAD